MNKPELLPKGEFTPVIDVAGFLTEGEVRRAATHTPQYLSLAAAPLDAAARRRGQRKHSYQLLATCNPPCTPAGRPHLVSLMRCTAGAPDT